METELADVPTRLTAAEAVSFVDARLTQIQAENETLHAIISLTPEAAHEDTVRVVAARESGRALPLDGMTFVAKDNIDVATVPGTVGSVHFQHRRPARDAAVISAIRRKGGVLLGTANLHELAYGGTSDNPHFGTVRNPWELDRSPGGSSGGSAVSVAVDWVTTALGTDTGGSVRCPAAITGVTGLRPTFGTVSQAGVFPLAASFDTVGFFARSVGELRSMWSVATGVDPRRERLRQDKPQFIGVPVNPYFTRRVEDDIAHANADVGALLSARGHTLREIWVPSPELCDEVARLLVRAEAYAVHGQRILDYPDEFGPDVVSRLLLGRELEGERLETLHRERARLSNLIDGLFAEVDLLLLPTVPASTPRVGSGSMLEVTERNLAFTYLWGLAGLPAVSVPAGIGSDGLPIGAQLVGSRGSDALLLEVARQFQRSTDWHLRRPDKAAFVPTSNRTDLGEQR